MWFSRSGGVQAAIPVRCTAAKSISAREARGTGGIRSSGKEEREGPVGPVGAGGPVSLLRDSNTRRIKPTGNQTFQYPCSCRIYAIKRPLRRRPALLPVFFFSIRLSLSLTPSLCRLVTERLSLRRMFNTRACICVHVRMCTRVYTPLYSHICVSRRCSLEGWRTAGKGSRACPPLNLIQFNIIDVQCRAI